MQKSFWNPFSKLAVFLLICASGASLPAAQDPIPVVRIISTRGEVTEARLVGADPSKIRIITPAGAGLTLDFSTIQDLQFVSKPAISELLGFYQKGDLEKANAGFGIVLPSLERFLWIEQAGLAPAFVSWIDGLRQVGQFDKAREILQRLHLVAENGEARKALLAAAIDVCQGRSKPVEEFLKTAPELPASNPDFVLDRMVRARAFLLNNQPREALNAVAEALCGVDQSHPNYPELLVLAEECYRKAGGQKLLSKEIKLEESSEEALMETEVSDSRNAGDPRTEIAFISPQSYWAAKSSASELTALAFSQVKAAAAGKTNGDELPKVPSQNQSVKDIWSEFRTSPGAQKEDP